MFEVRKETIMKLGLTIAAVGLLAVSAFAGVDSGLKPGASVGAFQVVDVNGPNKGEQLCYRCSYGNNAVVAAFINGDASKSSALVADLQKMVDARKAKGLKSFVVFMGGPELKQPIQSIAKNQKISLPMTFLPKGVGEGDIAAYKINPSAHNTILLWKEGTVRKNFVDVDSASLATVQKAIDAML